MNTILLAASILLGGSFGPQSRPATKPLSLKEAEKAQGLNKAWSSALAALDVERMKSVLKKAGTPNVLVYLPNDSGKLQRFTFGEYARNFRQFAGVVQSGRLKSFVPKRALTSDTPGTSRATAAFVFTVMNGERATTMNFEMEIASYWVRQGKQLKLSELRVLSEKRSF